MSENPIPWQKLIDYLYDRQKDYGMAIVSGMAESERSPFKVLISTVISLRTKDEVTGPASERLYALGETPAELLEYTEDQIAEAIYPAGFYKNKSKQILGISKILVEKYNGNVPSNRDGLVALPGVGQKTANLVLSIGFNIPAICVDIHVHRICNRWGVIETKNPDETEVELMKILPEKHWIEINDLLVTYGQNICKPVSPFCSKCGITDFCQKVGVDKSR